MVTANEMECGFMPGKRMVNALVLQESYGKKKRRFYMFCGFGEGF